jgi:hypothetical protein
MENTLKSIIWNQFGASIDMLENAIESCPENLWETETRFWYNAFHTLFFLDYYLTLDTANFSPPAPFTLSEFEEDVFPRPYSKAELLSYLQFCREKCRNLISTLSADTTQTLWSNQSKTMVYPLIEILLYNMRHVQHHAAQLNLLLRQGMEDAPRWVFRAKDSL